ncbi:pentapeptide repeat-containing protein [Scytonema hofmannii]
MRQICLQYALFINGYCKDALLEEANLTGAELAGFLFFGSCLNRAVLRKVKADNTGFNRAMMVQADLQGGSFVGATFNKADLTQANLTSGDFSQADFREAKLDGVNWDDTLLKDALFDPRV